MARFFSQVRSRPVDANGNPYPAAKLYFYIAGTTTPQNVYSDSTLVTPLSNPVVADANGQFVQIYMSAATYRVDFKTSADVLLASDDNVDIGLGLGSGALSILLGGTGASTASGARSNLGLGTAATKDTGVAAGNVPLLGASAELSATVLANSIVALTEDTTPALTSDFVITYDLSATTAKKVKPSNLSKVSQIASAEDGAVATGTTVIPYDDTIPQNTEGDQYISVSITPLSATSTLIITANIYLSASTPVHVSLGLFQDATAGALAAIATFVGTANAATTITLTHKMTSGTTSATTFKIRAGPNSAATLTFNGSATARRFGGVAASTIAVTEVLP